jgi:hypothetical protein
MRDLTPLGKLVVIVLLFGLCSLVFALVLGCSGGEGERRTGPSPTCAHWCAMSIGCPGDPDPNCLGSCAEMVKECPSEMRALIRCQLSLPDSGLTCNSNGLTDAKGSECVLDNARASWCRWF